MARRPRRRRASVSCPQCGGEFPEGRLACPHCGSDAQTGWKEGSDERDFTDSDYEEVVADLEGKDDLGDPKWRRRKRFVVIVGLALVAIWLYLFLKSGRTLW